MNLEVVQSTSFNSLYPASSVLILGEQDAGLGNGPVNFWLAENRKTTGQGFTMKVDSCARWVAGVQIKNIGEGIQQNRATRGFKVSSSKNLNGPWKNILEDELVDTTGGNAASLLNFTFEDPVELQYLRFDLVSYWGFNGGGLQYFAPIPVASKYKHNNSFFLLQGGLSLTNHFTQLTAT